jgi:hypothetical protein
MSPMVWALAGLGLLFGFGAREVKRFEDLAAKDIAATLEGPEKQVKVRSELNGFVGGALGDLRRVTISARNFSTPALPLFVEPELSAKGKVRELKIVLEEFELAGLRVERLEAAIPDCRFDYDLALRKKKIRLSRSGVGEGRVRLREKDVESFLLEKLREIKRVELRLDRERAFVKGYGEFLVVHTEFEVIARLAPLEGNKIVLAEAKVFFGEHPADEEVKGLILDTLNPVVDLDEDLKLYGAVTLEGLSLQNGILEAWGRTRIPARPQGQEPQKTPKPPMGSIYFRSARERRTAPATSSTVRDSIFRSSARRAVHRSPKGWNRFGSVGP